MAGTSRGDNGRAVKINELNSNVKRFLEYVRNDPKAKNLKVYYIIGFGWRDPSRGY